MTATVSVLPTYPIPNRVAKVTVGSTLGDYVRVWVTDAPPGSEFKEKIDAVDANQVKAFEGDSGSIWDFEPDVDGAYVLKLDEITKGATDYGGRYEGDPDAHADETIVGTNTATIYVGTRMTGRVGTAENAGTLVVYLFNTTIRATTLTLHGEETPAIIETTSEKARTAAEASAVDTALTALVDVTGATAVGDFGTVVDDLCDKLNAHFTQASVHANNDADNTILTDFLDPSTPTAVALSLREFQRRLSQHMVNDESGTGPGSAASAYHSPSAVDKSDLANSLLVTSASESDLQGMALAIGDAWRAYEAHRVSTVHDASDSTNTATALPKLLDVHNKFFAELAKATATAPPTANPGVTPLAQLAGMEPTPE